MNIKNVVSLPLGDVEQAFKIVCKVTGDKKASRALLGQLQESLARESGDICTIVKGRESNTLYLGYGKSARMTKDELYKKMTKSEKSDAGFKQVTVNTNAFGWLHDLIQRHEVHSLAPIGHVSDGVTELGKAGGNNAKKAGNFLNTIG